MSVMVFDPSSGPDGPVAAKVESVGWGIFFIWIGVALLAGVGWAGFFMGTGVIMLGGQVARRLLSLKPDRFALMLGIVFVGASALHLLHIEWQTAALAAWLVPALFIAAGAAIVLSAWRRQKRD